MAATDYKPIIKWAGGKRRLVPDLLKHVPPKVRTYVEPFAGGAALFFALRAAVTSGEKRVERVVLSDHNHELTALYRVVRDDVESLIEALRPFRYNEAQYYRIREQDPRMLDDVSKAARFLYLNRTGYNGLYRVNSKGFFNVPFGRYKNPAILDEARLRLAADALAQVDIRTGDFAAVLTGLKRGDFVYFDPPYVPVSRTAAFTDYQAGGFDGADQARLADLAARLAKRGVGVLLSNADVPAAVDLYDRFSIERVLAARSINSSGARRGAVSEVLVYANSAISSRTA